MRRSYGSYNWLTLALIAVRTWRPACCVSFRIVYAVSPRIQNPKTPIQSYIINKLNWIQKRTQSKLNLMSHNFLAKHQQHHWLDGHHASPAPCACGTCRALVALAPARPSPPSSWCAELTLLLHLPQRCRAYCFLAPMATWCLFNLIPNPFSFTLFSHPSQ